MGRVLAHRRHPPWRGGRVQQSEVNRTPSKLFEKSAALADPDLKATCGGFTTNISLPAVQLLALVSRKAIILARSSAEAMPPYGFILCPDTTCSGLAMKRSSEALSHTRSAPFIALE